MKISEQVKDWVRIFITSILASITFLSGVITILVIEMFLNSASVLVKVGMFLSGIICLFCGIMLIFCAAILYEDMVTYYDYLKKH